MAYPRPVFNQPKQGLITNGPSYQESRERESYQLGTAPNSNRVRNKHVSEVSRFVASGHLGVD
jgi:hypothetical protein